jgi:hypothetical protein
LRVPSLFKCFELRPSRKPTDADQPVRWCGRGGEATLPHAVCMCRTREQRMSLGAFNVAAAIGVPAQADNLHSCPNLFAMGTAILCIRKRNASTGRIAAFLWIRHSSPSSIRTEVMPRWQHGGIRCQN